VTLNGRLLGGHGGVRRTLERAVNRGRDAAKAIDAKSHVLHVLRRAPFPRPTMRGWTLIALGIALLVAGIIATTGVAVSAGLLLLLLVVAGIAVASIVAGPLRASRSFGRQVVEVGEVFRETVEIRGRESGIVGASRLLVNERLGHEFASMSDMGAVVEIGPGVPPARLELEAIATHRGRSFVGPLTVRVEDPFGLLRIDRVVAPETEIVIVPRAVTMGAIDAGALAGAVSAEQGRVGQGGSADDSELRPYRPGDPIRRVHWGQSARRGELHVRQTTQAQPPEAIVALDIRRAAYQDLGRDDLAELADLGGDAAFEHAVVVAASVARSLASRTSRVVLVTDQDTRGSVVGLSEVLIGLADVEVRTEASPVQDVLGAVGWRDAHGMTAVVTGHCSAADANDIVSNAAGSSRGLFVSVVPPSPAVRGVFDRAGWRILTVPVPHRLAVDGQRRRV
jgi:uncharacterized protein (DUF58 family)